MKNQLDEEFSRSPSVIKNKIRKRRIITEVFNDYCTSTSIHGIGYLGAENRSFPEKIWWIIVFILSVIACSYLIAMTWIKWKNNPVILSFEKEQIPIRKIPFPAVTICPVNKVRQTYYNYTEKFRNRHNLTEEEYKEFWDVSLVCNLDKFRFVSEFNCSLNLTDEFAIEKIRENAPSLLYTLNEVKWQNQMDWDYSYFADQITEEGLCFTFNSLSQEDMFTEEININNPDTYILHGIKNNDWSIEDGYSGKIKMSDYPRRTARDGIASGLRISLMTLNDDIDYVCGMPITGYKFILHNPAEIPKAAEQYFLVPSNRKANVIIKPELTKTPKSLVSISPHTRKCYFSNEKVLRFFKVYTQNNCRMECDANITLEYCNCVPFYLPRPANASICGFASRGCIDDMECTVLEIEMRERDTNMSEEKEEKIKYTREIYDKCDCLPSCNSLQYSAEISQSDYHIVKGMLTSGELDDIIPKEMQDELNKGMLILTQVDIFFKESQFYALQRSEIYGRVDFLANIGGLLGLFMGFSILSLLEIVYFVTIRIWFKYNERKLSK